MNDGFGVPAIVWQGKSELFQPQTLLLNCVEAKEGIEDLDLTSVKGLENFNVMFEFETVVKFKETLFEE
jgi:hypothetical protein